MSSQPPSQAGKFRPKKQKPKKSTSIKPPSANSNSSSKTSSGAKGQEKSKNRDKSPGRGRGSGDRGRGGRGRGRGRGGRGGRGGRFVQPKGQVFFTASSTASDNPNNKGGSSTTGSSSMLGDVTTKDDVVIMPGMSGTTNSKSSGPSLVASTASGRLAAAAQARKGEGDEIIVGEIEEGHGVGDGRKSAGGILDRMSDGDKKPSMYDNEEEDDDNTLTAGDFTYDSDSSTDGEPKRIALQMNASMRQGGRGRPQPAPLQPQQLPMPPTKRPGLERIDFMYECQVLKESKSNGVGGGNNKDSESKRNELILDDPPLEPPFLNLKKATPEHKIEEQKSWMIFKFPTRLPRLDTQSTLSGMAVKKEGLMDDMMDVDSEQQDSSGLIDPSGPTPDVASSSFNSKPKASSTGGGGNTAESTSGFDDTLKDSASGRYGKIVVYKSGKAYLIVGDNDTKTPPVRMRLANGLSCGFLQQAVSIDTENGYIPLGEVKKSIIVTPDVEEAFPK
jgi:hypothetical protein